MKISFHGAARSTVDVDIVAELDATSAAKLVTSLQGAYYASTSAALDAVRRRSCFNLIHLDTAFKVDVFVSKGRPYDQSAFARASAGQLMAADPMVVPIASAEDTIVAKFEWYRLGGDVSERQWNDVKTVARLKGEQLDFDYVRQAALQLGVVDLLARLLMELDVRADESDKPT